MMKPAPIRMTLAVAAFIAGFGGLLGFCSTPLRPRFALDPAAMSRREESLLRVPVHFSEFTTMAHPLALPRCGDTRPPEALATPDPLLQLEDGELRVRVSFIVGTDGHVYSPFILDSGGPVEDQVVLHVIRRWRYRPALCNGVPTDSEARVQFSNR